MEENKNTEKNEEILTDAVSSEDNTGEACQEKKKKKKSELDSLKKEIEELKQQLDDKNDKYLRMAAEYDNFRRRSREEKEAAYGTATADAVAAFLPLIDNLERAGTFTDAEKVKVGLEMIAGSVNTILQGLGIEAFGEAGEKFDPNLHNAVMHTDDDTERENEITEVFQKGYKKGTRIIRFAVVSTVN